MTIIALINHIMILPNYFQSNRNSNPFKEPIDAKSNPKYFEVVKEPMGKFNINNPI